MSEKSPRNARGSLTGTGGFEKRGGYSPVGDSVAKLPKVPPGPAPGSSASRMDSSSESDKQE